MTSQIGIEIGIIVCMELMLVKSASEYALIAQLILFARLLSDTLQPFGICHSYCVFCGKPIKGSIWHVLTYTCKHSDDI